MRKKIKWRSKQLNKEGRSYYSIGEVAALVGIEEHILRYWEKMVPELNPKRSPNSGARMYQDEDVELAKQLYHLIEERGYTVSAAAKLVGDEGLTSELAIRERLLEAHGRLQVLHDKIVSFHEK